MEPRESEHKSTFSELYLKGYRELHSIG